jgi:hypothetical protein
MTPDWHKLEAEFAALPRRDLATLAARGAARAAPVLAQAADHYGPEAFEWLRAVLGTIDTVTRLGAGETVSRFTLDLAADAARCAANAMSGAAQLLGPASGHHECELAVAAAAFAADCARAKSPADGPLWPDGEPAWFTDGMARYARVCSAGVS